MTSGTPRRLALPVGTPLYGQLRLRSRHRSLKHNHLYGTLYLNKWYKVFFSPDGLLVSRAFKWMPAYPVTWLVEWDAVFERTSYAYLEDVAMALERLVPLVVKGRPQAQVLDPAFNKLYPLLGQHMTQLAWSDGKPRDPSTMSIFTDGPLWKVFLNERNSRQSLCVTAATHAELLAVLETSLGSGCADWRARPEKAVKAGKGK